MIARPPFYALTRSRLVVDRHKLGHLDPVEGITIRR
jgi:hypothetical protein